LSRFSLLYFLTLKNYHERLFNPPTSTFLSFPANVGRN